jgi:hypothetical protein
VFARIFQTSGKTLVMNNDNKLIVKLNALNKYCFSSILVGKADLSDSAFPLKLKPDHTMKVSNKNYTMDCRHTLQYQTQHSSFGLFCNHYAFWEYFFQKGEIKQAS